MGTADLSGGAAWAVGLVEALGGPGAGLAVALENVFPPLPSEVILPLTGFAASRGELSLGGAIGWTTAGSLAGALLLYGLGRAWGRDRLRAAWERLPLTDLRDLDRTEAWFERHGRKAVFYGRMLPVFRSLVSVPAGVTRMPMAVFVALTLAGSLVWNTALVLAGYALGEQWHRVTGYGAGFQRLVLAGLLLALGWWVVRRLRRRP